MKNTPLLYGFWDRVDEAVRRSGLSRQEIAKRANIHRKTLMEHNDRAAGMHSRTLAAFCMVTGADANWLLGLKKGET